MVPVKAANRKMRMQERVWTLTMQKVWPCRYTQARSN